jgi:hypothetical protein
MKVSFRFRPLYLQEEIGVVLIIGLGSFGEEKNTFAENQSTIPELSNP